MKRPKKKTREQVSKPLQCTVCERPFDATRLHATTCSARCRQERSRTLARNAIADAIEANKQARKEKKKQSRKEEPIYRHEEKKK